LASARFTYDLGEVQSRPHFTQSLGELYLGRRALFPQVRKALDEAYNKLKEGVRGDLEALEHDDLFFIEGTTDRDPEMRQHTALGTQVEGGHFHIGRRALLHMA
jgi:hypothetical protein